MTPLQIRIVDNDEIYIRILFYAICRGGVSWSEDEKVQEKLENDDLSQIERRRINSSAISRVSFR